MPIWSLTAERLEKLMDAIAKKKTEHDDLLALNEKDLWCRDLDEFMAEWDNQLALAAEIKTNIRRLGRRVSKKIGAGRGRKVKDEDDYEPEKKSRGRPKAAAAKAAPKAAPAKETKSAQRFVEKFGSKPKVKEEKESDVVELSDNFSDDDFAALGKGKSAAKASQSQPQSEVEAVPVRTKRAAASKARTIFDDEDSESDDDQMLGDVGALVKGIDKPAGESSGGRLSLYAMNRPDSSHGNGSSGGLPKPKTKSAKSFDFDSPDDTNYEMLAKSSPHKTATKGDHIDSFLSDDDPVPSPAKPAVSKATSLSSTVAGLASVKKPRGRPAGAKAKAKDDAKPEPKPKAAPKSRAKAVSKASTLSPAAKAYAARKAVKKTVLDDDSDEEMEELSSPPPRPAARARPGRAAAARRPVVIDDEDSSMMEDQQNDDESEDPFEVDDDED